MKPDENKNRLPASIGIPFFAIVHIFCFHLCSLHDLDKEPGLETLLQNMSRLPKTLSIYLSHGWMSTSFFFLLSGFILAYLYWEPDGTLSISRRKFWVQRLARIYPIHLLLTLVAFVTMTGYQLSHGIDVPMLIASGIATLALVQSWYPDFVPVWSWPTWAVSTLVFLYAVTPFLMPALAKLSRRQSVALLCLLPLLSLIPTGIYALHFPTGSKPQQFWQIFIGSTPVFWLAHFTAGLLPSRVFSLARHDTTGKPGAGSWLAWGDLSLLACRASRSRSSISCGTDS